jgi:Cu/Ag efflux protein CusF
MSLKRIVPAAVLVAILAGPALAASKSLNGEIKSIDATKGSIVLATGEVFQLPKQFDAKTLKVGEKVAVTYDTNNGKMVASAVKAM